MTEVLLFTQETCGACTTQREKNEGIEDAYPDVEFREVNIQTDLETAEEYGVRKTPTTLVYANGDRTPRRTWHDRPLRDSDRSTLGDGLGEPDSI